MKQNWMYFLIYGLAFLLLVPGAMAGQNADAKYNVDFNILTAGNDNDIILNDLREGEDAIGAETQFALAVYGTGFQNLKSYDLHITYDSSLIDFDGDNSSEKIGAFIVLNGELVQPSSAEDNILAAAVLPTIVTQVSDNEVVFSRTLSGEITEEVCPDGDGLLFLLVFKTKADFPTDRAFRITVSQLTTVDYDNATDDLRHNFYGYVNRHGVGVESTTWGALKTLFK